MTPRKANSPLQVILVLALIGAGCAVLTLGRADADGMQRDELIAGSVLIGAGLLLYNPNAVIKALQRVSPWGLKRGDDGDRGA